MDSIRPRGLYRQGVYVPSLPHYRKPVDGQNYLWDVLIGPIIRRDVYGQMFVFIKQEKAVSVYLFKTIVDLQALDMVKL